jgi:hypothetical protein
VDDHHLDYIMKLAKKTMVREKINRLKIQWFFFSNFDKKPNIIKCLISIEHNTFKGFSHCLMSNCVMDKMISLDCPLVLFANPMIFLNNGHSNQWENQVLCTSTSTWIATFVPLCAYFPKHGTPWNWNFSLQDCT